MNCPHPKPRWGSVLGIWLFSYRGTPGNFRSQQIGDLALGHSADLSLSLTLGRGIGGDLGQECHHLLPVHCFLLSLLFVRVAIGNGECRRYVGVAADDGQQIAHQSVCVCVLGVTW